MKKLLIFLLLGATCTGFSQNLVENPSFENTPGTLLCSWYVSKAEFNSAIASWTMPTGGSTDIFSMTLATTCYCSPLSTHASSPGQQVPRTGQKMCNITVYGSGGCTPYREYLQGHLSSPMVPGQQYVVEFYVSFADWCTYATNNLGVYFTTTAVDVTSMCVYNVTPQCNYTGAPITDYTGWVLVSFNFTPTAAYNYFMLGNFYSDAATTTVNMGGPKGTVRYFVDDVAIYPVNTAPTSTFTATTPLCDGDASTVTYTGTGTAGATYNWNWDGGIATPGTGQGPHTVTWPGPGTYDITLSVTEGGNTSTVTTQTVVVNPVPTATFTAVSPVCVGSNSTITYTGSGGPGATYTWDFNGGIIASGSGSGPYQVYWNTSGNYVVSLTVTENGCSSTYTVPVKVDPNPTSTFTVISPVCVGVSSTITYTGSASPAANYNWNFNGGIVDSGTGQGPYQVHWNTAGTYNVTLTVDENGCNSTPTTVPVTVTQIPTSTFTVTPILCFGNNTTITYTGNATAGGTYTWDFNGGTIASGTGQGPYQVNWGTAGTYTISLQVSEGGCTSGVTQQVVTNPSDLSTIVNTNSVTCFSGANGSVCVNVTGGQSPYTYSWSNGTGSNFAAGSYTVTVTDNNGCTDVAPFTITQPTQLAWQTNQTNLLCYQDNSGSASITVNDGTPPYTYAWSNGGSNSAVTNLAAGTYTVTVTDANLCTFSESIIVTEPTQLLLTANTISNASCAGNCDGSATATASGGTPVYLYLWSTGTANSTAGSLCAGTPGVTVTDANGCTANASVTITEPAPLTASISSFTNASCNGLCDGSATVAASGGTSPYFYNWPTGANNQTAGNLCSGNYTVTITDANGCTANANVTITEASAVTAAISGQSDITCNGACDGVFSLQVTGGTPSYTYNWTGGLVVQNPSGLCAGTYYVTVTDQNGCSATTYGTLTEPPLMTVQISNYTNPSCYGVCDGSADVSAGGGVAPYSYLWNNGNTTATGNNLCSGTYTVTVTDINGCSVSVSVTLTEPSQITVGSPGNMTICNGTSETLIATATGGNPPYDFFWNGVLSNPIITVSPTSATTYSVYAVDNNGCMSSNTANTVISVTPGVQMQLFASTGNVCPGDPVIISSNISMGVPPYMVFDNQGNVVSPPFTVNPVITSSYSYYVTDGCGSTAIDDITIGVYPLPAVSFSPDTVRGCEPLTVHFNNMSNAMSYAWNFGDNDMANLSYDENPNHTYDDPGVYDVTLTATSAEGCVNNVTYEDLITVYPVPTAKFTADPEVASVIKPVIFFENQSINADSYIWVFGDGDTSSQMNPWHTYPIYPTGAYNVMLIAYTVKGCSDTTWKEIRIADEFTFYAPTAFSPDFDGINDFFNVKGNGIDPRSFHLTIYDRWGEVVFETDDLYQGWDGRIKDGEIGKNGTYTWLATFRNLQGTEHQEAGAVTIIR
ncbi:MAG: PKD domain-containing protein [Bacteroidota bacterium]